MANRGRGTLSVRKSNNPFFQTTNQAFGEDFSEDVEFTAPSVLRAAPKKKLEDEFDFGFQYARAAEEIGKGIPQSDSRLSSAMAQGDSLSQISRLKSGTTGMRPVDEETSSGDNATQRAESILQHYKHNPRNEHSMYQTNNNMYGVQKPTVATFTADRKARSQAFSNSFNGVKFRDQGLNTSLIRSQVHNALDLH